ncbi:MAG: pilus assembly protein [Microthrixaceae bacterium]|nr:pilus assembly protein [Microthrixaceae bacterium]
MGPIRRLRRSRRSPNRGDRGATMVEFALILPVLALFTFGILEVGLVLRAQGQNVTASQSAARTASHLGDDRLADYSAITAALAALPDTGEIQALVVFKPTNSGGLPSGCESASRSNVCNRYDKAFITQLVNAEQADPGSGSTYFGGVTSCSGSAPDRWWCPTTRQARQSTGLDSIGVRIELRHQSLTNLFGSTRDMSDQAISRIEPRLSSTASD